MRKAAWSAGALVALAAIGAGASLAAPATPSLSGNEVASLKYARQQAKLARDVYRTLDGRWNIRAFATLARSESRQMAAIKALLTRFRVSDPVADKGTGRFADPTFERAYQSYVRQGQRSRWDAHSAALRMERAELRELRARLLTAAHPDVRRLLTQMQRLSASHVHTLEHQAEESDHDRDGGHDG